MLKKIRKIKVILSLNQKKVFSNLGWLFADRFLQMGTALFIGLWTARYLGPEQFGSLNYAISFAALFGIIVNLGLDSIVVRDIVRFPDLKLEILGTAFILQIVGGIASIPIIVGLNQVMRPNDPLMQWLVLIASISGTFNAFNIISFWFQSQIDSKYTVFVKNGAYLFTAAVRLVLIAIQAPLIAFAIALAGEMMLSGIGLVIVYQQREKNLQKWAWSYRRAKELLRDSFPMMITGAVITIYMRTDSIMLGQMVGDQAVGLYTAVMKLAEMWYFVPAAITSTVFPIIIKLKENNEKVYYKRAQQLFTLMAFLSYLVAVPVSIFSNQLIVLFYGQEYAEGGIILAVYVWAGLFVSLGVARGPWMVAGDLLNFRAFAGVLGAITNIILNWILIPKIGIMGATIATIFSQFIASYLCNAFHSKTRDIFIRQTKGIVLFELPKIIRAGLQMAKS
ncbi:MAG: flippase [Spirulina sp.]